MGIEGGVEFARINMRKSAVNISGVSRGAGNSSPVTEKIARKDSHQRQREVVMKQ